VNRVSHPINPTLHQEQEKLAATVGQGGPRKGDTVEAKAGEVANLLQNTFKFTRPTH
jgi:hypothetical protein